LPPTCRPSAFHLFGDYSAKQNQLTCTDSISRMQ
jgi:hypothetical protein